MIMHAICSHAYSGRKRGTMPDGGEKHEPEGIAVRGGCPGTREVPAEPVPPVGVHAERPGAEELRQSAGDQAPGDLRPVLSVGLAFSC